MWINCFYYAEKAMRGYKTKLVGQGVINNISCKFEVNVIRNNLPIIK